MSIKRRVLVTGADGFIGSHLTEALVRRGYAVRAFVWYNSFNSWGWLDRSEASVRRRLDVFSGDIRDPNGVREAMKDCDAVLHLAALIGIPYSYHSPDSYIDTNIKGTLNVVQAARLLGTRRIVQTSTSEVYGTARTVPIAEDHPLCGQSPYAASKIGADEIALSFYRSFGTPVTVLRPFNTYGPRQSARAIIPTVITQVASGRTRVRLGSLHPTRDLTYVSDTAAGFIAALEAKGIEGRTINLGTGHEISIGELAHLIGRSMGRRITIVSEEERKRPALSEVERLCSDNTRAAELLGWRPRYAGRPGLERGLAETIRWFRDPANLAGYKADRCNI
ncbi:MAG: UDP-glucose 4-epimerase [Candidatus Omnitrophica bacterium]|nr:UDP-glucose 4-epimerase [Candidatus Omnitrophota bacterium]